MNYILVLLITLLAPAYAKADCEDYKHPRPEIIARYSCSGEAGHTKLDLCLTHARDSFTLQNTTTNYEIFYVDGIHEHQSGLSTPDRENPGIYFLSLYANTVRGGGEDMDIEHSNEDNLSLAHDFLPQAPSDELRHFVHLNFDRRKLKIHFSEKVKKNSILDWMDSWQQINNDTIDCKQL